MNVNLFQFGHGPLHEAAIQQPMDILESFIELGMDPNMKNTVIFNIQNMLNFPISLTCHRPRTP